MMKRVLLLAAAISVSACTVAPYKRPLDSANASKLREAGVYAKVDDRGVGVQYFAKDTSTAVAGAPLGVLGAVVVSLAAHALVNSGPIGFAEHGATELAPSFNHERTDAQFNESLQAQLEQVPLFGAGPTIQTLDQERRWAANEFSEPTALLTGVEYSLTRDLRSLEVVLTAMAVSKAAVQKRKRGSRKGLLDEGIVYRNRIEYRSAALAAIPKKTPQQIEAEIEQIKVKYSEASLAKSNDRFRANSTTGERQKAMKREIARVHDTPPAVLAEYYLGSWLANDAVLLRNELQAGLAVVSELLARDLQDATPVDKADNLARTILVTGDQRVVSRMNMPPFKGSLISEPVKHRRLGGNGVAYARKKKAEAASAPAAGQR